MEQGDLATWMQPRLIVVLEGVLATVKDQYEKPGRFRRKRHVVRVFHWQGTPIKRLVYLKTQWPDTSVEVITFLDQAAADEAADFFDRSNVPVSSVSYRPYKRWIEEIKWQPDIKTIYDSDVDRVMNYGQRGYVVQRGEDFH